MRDYRPSTEIDRRAEEAARNRSRLARYYAARSVRAGRPVPVHSGHRHLFYRPADRRA